MPFFRYCSATLARLSLKITTLCHSVFSLRSPEFLSRQLSEVATRMLTTGSPEFSRRISGSAPRLPTRMTLLTLPAMTPLRAHPKPKTGRTLADRRPDMRRAQPKRACCPQIVCSLFVPSMQKRRAQEPLEESKPGCFAPRMLHVCRCGIFRPRGYHVRHDRKPAKARRLR